MNTLFPNGFFPFCFTDFINDVLKKSDEVSDPLNLKERNSLRSLLEANDPSKGILIVFHGAPKTGKSYNYLFLWLLNH